MYILYAENERETYIFRSERYAVHMILSFAFECVIDTCLMTTLQNEGFQI